MKRLIISVLLGVAMLGGVLGSQASADDGGRKVRVRVNPVYPELAKRMNASGTVKLEVEVAANGDVKSVKAIGGHPILINAAEDAVRKWKYEPASGASTAVVEFHFASN